MHAAPSRIFSPQRRNGAALVLVGALLLSFVGEGPHVIETSTTQTIEATATQLLLTCIHVGAIAVWATCLMRHSATVANTSDSPIFYTMSQGRQLATSLIFALLVLLLELARLCLSRVTDEAIVLWAARFGGLLPILAFALFASSGGAKGFIPLFGMLLGKVLWTCVPQAAKQVLLDVADGGLVLVYVTYGMVFAAMGYWFCLRSRIRKAKTYRATRDLISALRQDETYASLSPREQEIAACILGGMTLKEIATLLDVPASTAGTYRKRLFDKLGVATKAELIERYSTSARQGGTAVSNLVEKGLAARDAMVLVGIAQGKTAKQVARELYVSPSTVAQCRARGYRALRVTSKRELMDRIEGIDETPNA